MFSPANFHAEFLVDPVDLYCILIDPSDELFLVTDGGADGVKSSYAWALATKSAQLLLIADGLCFGYRPSSFCSETTALTYATTFLKLLLDFGYSTFSLPDSDALYEYTLGTSIDDPIPPTKSTMITSLSVLSDSDSLIKKIKCLLLSKLALPRAVLSPEWDLLQRLISNIQVTLDDPSFTWVRGHQDSPTDVDIPNTSPLTLTTWCPHCHNYFLNTPSILLPHLQDCRHLLSSAVEFTPSPGSYSQDSTPTDSKTLSLQAYLNILADLLATERLASSTGSTFWAPTDPTAQSYFHLHGATITNNIWDRVRADVHNPISYLCDRYEWSQLTYSTIDWDSFGIAFSRKSKKNWQFTFKLCNRKLPTGLRLSKIHQKHDCRCSSCTAEIEDDNHIFQCPVCCHLQYEIIRRLKLKVFKFLDPTLQTILREGIFSYFNNQPPPNPSRFDKPYSALVEGQNEIGWEVGY